MKRGTIVLTRFPFTDLSSIKRRPALIVSQTESPEGDVIVAFITSNTDKPEIKTDLSFTESDKSFIDSGLKKSSLIRLAKLSTLNKSIFTGELGFLHEETMKLVDEKLKLALGLQ